MFRVQKLIFKGRLKEALRLLQLIVQQSPEDPHSSFVCLLRACTRRKALAEGKQVHALILKTESGPDLFLSNLLMEMYSACGSAAEALKVFTAMPHPNAFSWTAMMSAWTKSRQYKEVLALFQKMQQAGIEPSKGACIMALKACTNIGPLKQGHHLHFLILNRGFDSNLTLQTTLIDMYSKWGCLKDARELFDNMRIRDVVTWTAMIAGYAEKGLGKEALDLYKQMKDKGIEPNATTLVLLLKACAGISALRQGKQLHSLILQKGLESQLMVQTALLDMYSKCGCLQDARELFDNMAEQNVVSWTAMIAGYVQEGLGQQALDLYEQMKHESIEPNNITFGLLLKGCASVLALEQGRHLHSLILERGWGSELCIQNTLIDMYSKCGCLKNARELFDHMTPRNVVSWNAMIAGYAQGGFGKEALDLYEQMKLEGMEPDNITLVLLLKSCAGISALQQGKHLHSLILQKGLESELIVQATLIDMYSKCGFLKDARELFDHMTTRNVVSWNAMIAGYAQGGLGKEALDLLHQMEEQGLQANDVTYSCVLSACNNSGLVEEGSHVFESMSKDHCVTPTLEHYACPIDLMPHTRGLALGL